MASFRISQKWLLMIALLLNVSGFSQDSIAFKNGQTKPVQVVELQFGNELLIYLDGKDTAIAPFFTLEKIYYQQIWQHPALFGPSPDSDMGFEKSEFLFKKLKGHTEQPFNLALNLCSPFLAHDGSVVRSELFNDNRTIGVDFEYRFHDKFSIKIPIIVGLEIPANTGEHTFNAEDYYYYSYPPNIFCKFWAFTGEDPATGEIDVLSRGYGNNQNRDFPHERTLIYQGGIGFKYFPFGHSRQELFIGQSFNFGQADMASVDYYYDFDTIITSTGLPNYHIINERAVVSPNKFIFFRYEASVGLTFNIGKYIAFTYEAGYSTLMKNRGSVEDRVYVKTFGDTYILKYSELFQSRFNDTNPYSYNELGYHRYRAGNITNRLTLVIRFGNKYVN